MERAIASALAEQVGVALDDLRVGLDAMLITRVLHIAGGCWTAAAMAGIPMPTYVRTVVDPLNAGIGPRPATAAGHQRGAL
jgi:hypothetical protein